MNCWAVVVSGLGGLTRLVAGRDVVPQVEKAPLHLAAEKGLPVIVRVLGLELKANVNATDQV